MNPENPMTPREETEMRITALLMGELSAEEAKALQAQIDADPELATLHRRLKHAAELLREASALPAPTELAAPTQISAERRARLLAHFKNAPPQTARPEPASIVPMPQRDRRWMVQMALAAGVILFLGIGVLLLVTSTPLKHSIVMEPDFAATDHEVVAFNETRADPVSQQRTWASQPGMIRVYRDRDANGDDGARQPHYALQPQSALTASTDSGASSVTLGTSTTNTASAGGGGARRDQPRTRTPHGRHRGCRTGSATIVPLRRHNATTGGFRGQNCGGSNPGGKCGQQHC